ncbi:MAG: hypothetical protein WC595_02595 [Candidatus Nanoarchaeia archaeon]
MTKEIIPLKRGIYPSLNADSSGSNRIKAIVSVIVSNIPGKGGILASFLTAYLGESVSSDKQREIITILEDLMIRVELLEDEEGRIKYLQSEGFEYIFRECIKGMANHYQAQKIAFFKGILLNSIKIDIEQDTKEYYLNLVNNLSELHLRILALLNDPENYFDFYNLNKSSVLQASFNDVIKIAIPNVPEEILKSAFADLYQKRFTTSDPSLFATLTSTKGFYVISGRVSANGKDFIKFCLESD